MKLLEIWIPTPPARGSRVDPGSFPVAGRGLARWLWPAVLWFFVRRAPATSTACLAMLGRCWPAFGFTFVRAWCARMPGQALGHPCPRAPSLPAPADLAGTPASRAGGSGTRPTPFPGWLPSGSAGVLLFHLPRFGELDGGAAPVPKRSVSPFRVSGRSGSSGLARGLRLSRSGGAA